MRKTGESIPLYCIDQRFAHLKPGQMGAQGAIYLSDAVKNPLPHAVAISQRRRHFTGGDDRSALNFQPNLSSVWQYTYCSVLLTIF